MLAVNVPVDSYGKKPEEINQFYKETIRRVAELPGVDSVAVGDATPWRDKEFSFALQFSTDGHVRPPGLTAPTAAKPLPGFFGALRVPILAGRDFNDLDRANVEPVVIISQTLAQRMFPGRDPINRHLTWTDPVIKFIGIEPVPRRIVGVVADIDDTHVIPAPTITVYNPMEQQGLFEAARSCTRTQIPTGWSRPSRASYAISADQPAAEPVATLEDIRAEVLTPDKLNSLVFGGFALVALAIAIVGVAGVLAFSVSARTREFGIRLAIGSQPSRLLAGVIREGAVMAALGIVAGAACGYVLARLAGSYLLDMKMPSPLPVVASAFILLVAAVAASALPAARAARVDVIQALRAE